MSKFKVGDRVKIPKTKGVLNDAATSAVILKALQYPNTRLYITRIDDDGTHVVYWEEGADDGDFFLEKDLELYYDEEPPAVPIQALRFNAGKAQYSMISLEAFEPMIRVLEFGAQKYARNNWKKGLKKSQILDSMLRHLKAMLEGEEIDPESGLAHIGHIQCNAMFLGHKSVIEDTHE